MYRISIQQIQYFLYAAETLNFTNAARKAFISQPALSKQIATLEQELNIQLFIRSKRSISLTPEGLSLYNDWSTLIKSLEQSIHNAKLIESTNKGHINIGWVDHFDFAEHLSRQLHHFSKKYPNIETNLFSYSFKNLRNGLESNELDFAVIPLFELQAYKDIQWIHLASINFGIAVPLSNPLSKKDHITVDDIKDQPFVVISSEESQYGSLNFKKTCREQGFEPNIIKYVPNINSLLLSVRNGDGLTFLHNKTKDPYIRIYDFDIDIHDLDLIIVWKISNKKPSLKTFIKELHY